MRLVWWLDRWESVQQAVVVFWMRVVPMSLTAINPLYELKEGRGTKDFTGQKGKYSLNKETQVQMETIVQN